MIDVLASTGDLVAGGGLAIAGVLIGFCATLAAFSEARKGR